MTFRVKIGMALGVLVQCDMSAHSDVAPTLPIDDIMHMPLVSRFDHCPLAKVQRWVPFMIANYQQCVFISAVDMGRCDVTNLLTVRRVRPLE